MSNQATPTRRYIVRGRDGLIAERMDDIEPGPFCVGVSGREQCDDCAGRYVAAPGWSVPPRILVHQPWPFEPCPHYVAPQAGDGYDVLTVSAGRLRGS